MINFFLDSLPHLLWKLTIYAIDVYQKYLLRNTSGEGGVENSEKVRYLIYQVFEISQSILKEINS